MAATAMPQPIPSLGVDKARLLADLDALNYALLPKGLNEQQCCDLIALYSDESLFRSRINMARHGFGQGEYQYFTYPLPALVQHLRTQLYPALARVANHWAAALGLGEPWPERHELLLQRCREAGQFRPTPLLLKYRSGDYNCLHQDLYGEVHFPLQAIVLLSRPERDFSGGALTLVENRPRRQSRCEVVPLQQGQIVIIQVRERPREGSRGVYRTQLRHGVSSILHGQRFTLGIPFHDAT